MRPNDPLAKKLVSKELTVQNVLLRVTVPKRTGRKRKRGSNDPFVFHNDQDKPLHGDASQALNSCSPNAEQLLRRLQDNPNAYTIQPVGPINQTSRFRALPDFQVTAGSQPVMQEVVQKLSNPTCKLVASKR